MSQGIFITIEGNDGAGKSTQIELLTARLEGAGRSVVRLREPGGTNIGEAIRQILLDAKNIEMTPECELFLYEAARAQIVHEVIEPALAAGSVVLCDRFFDSTVAYQACGRGLERAFVNGANMFATGGLVPDRTLFLYCDEESAKARIGTRGEKDRIELAGNEFSDRVTAGFLQLTQDFPERIRRVDATHSVEQTFEAVCAQLVDLLPELGGDF